MFGATKKKKEQCLHIFGFIKKHGWKDCIFQRGLIINIKLNYTAPPPRKKGDKHQKHSLREQALSIDLFAEKVCTSSDKIVDENQFCITKFLSSNITLEFESCLHRATLFPSFIISKCVIQYLLKFIKVTPLHPWFPGMHQKCTMPLTPCYQHSQNDIHLTCSECDKLHAENKILHK